MALIKFGGGVAGISGAIGGTVYARNRAGAYARNWAKPTNPVTQSQATQRANFGGNAFNWNGLSFDKKNGWAAASIGTTRLNRQGEAYQPTGRQLFMEANQNLVLAGLPQLDGAPDNFLSPDNTVVQGADIQQTLGVLTTFSLLNDFSQGDKTIVEVTPPVDPQISNVNLHYRTLGAFAPGADPYDILIPYFNLFGNAGPSGNSIWIRYSTVFASNGMRSPRQIVRGEIV